MDTMLQTSDTGIQMTQSESEQQLQHIVADELDASCLQYGMEMKTNHNFWQAISVFMFQGECTVNLNNLFSKPSTPILTWTNPRQSFLGNYDYASHFTYDNSCVSVRFHFLVCCSITFRCIVVDSGNMLFIQVKGTHGYIQFCSWYLSS